MTAGVVTMPAGSREREGVRVDPDRRALADDGMIISAEVIMPTAAEPVPYDVIGGCWAP